MAKTYNDTQQEADRGPFSKKTLENWRVRGEGPPYIKVGKGRNARVLYDPEQVDKWLAAQTVYSTSEAEAA
ncbi:MAG: hypothetical protein HRT64_10425 [Erythrobacter sp.]|nr:hypothetical protein [Erythrobacter sp.]